MALLQLARFAVVACMVQAADPEPMPRPLPADVTQVETGGYWKKGGKEGRYRAVVRTGCSPEHCYDSLYVDWISEGRNQASKVVATELISGGHSTVTALRFVLSKDATHLEIRSQAAEGDIKLINCLKLGLPGKYTSTSGACGGAG